MEVKNPRCTHIHTSNYTTTITIATTNTTTKMKPHIGMALHPRVKRERGGGLESRNALVMMLVEVVVVLVLMQVRKLMTFT
jgi:hypothetical protein